MSRILLFLIFILISLLLRSNSAIENSNIDYFNKYGFRYYTGNIFAHTKDVKNTSGAAPYGFEFELSKRLIGDDVWNLCRCYPTTGFLFAFKNYNSEILGYGFHSAYFVQYHFFPTLRMSPVVRGTGGLEYNTNPHNDKKNPENNSYSLPLNAYLQFAVGIETQLNNSFALNLLLGFNHISNGGIRQPNRGINWYANALSLNYTPNYSKPQRRSRENLGFDQENKWISRLEFYFSYLSETFDEKERLMVYGTEAIVGRRLNYLNSILAGLEWNLDMRVKRKIEHENLSANPNRFSLIAGHKFNLGYFRFSQKAGIYIYDDLKENDLLYHKWGMNYHFAENLIVGIDVKAHRNVAEYMSLRVGVAF